MAKWTTVFNDDPAAQASGNIVDAGCQVHLVDA
jgi:hypothetical protein